MFFGVGNYGFCTLDLEQSGQFRQENLLHPGCISAFSLEPDNQVAEAKCWQNGRIVNAASQITEETWSLSVTTEFLDWTNLQWSLDEIAQQSANIPLPLVKAVRIPVGAPSITDPDITALNAPGIKVYFDTRSVDNPQRFYFNVVNVAPAAPNEVQVDPVAGTLTFDASLEGATVQYVVEKLYTSIETIGVEGQFDRFGTMSWTGVVSGTENPRGIGVYLPNITRISTPTFELQGDKVVLVNNFRVNAPTIGRAVQWFELSTGV